jgi:hypothetical protein
MSHKAARAAWAIWAVLWVLAPAWGQPANDYLIVPGYRMGPVTFHSTLPEVEAQFGLATSYEVIRNFPEFRTVRYGWSEPNTKDLAFMLDISTFPTQHQERLEFIFIYSPRYHTRGGVHVGAPISAMLKEFGPNYQVRENDPLPGTTRYFYTYDFAARTYVPPSFTFDVFQGRITAIGLQ